MQGNAMQVNVEYVLNQKEDQKETEFRMPLRSIAKSRCVKRKKANQGKGSGEENGPGHQPRDERGPRATNQVPV